MEFHEKLLEPIKFYQELKEKYKERLNSIFDDLLKKSNIDIKENQKDIKEIEKLRKKHDSLGRWKKFYKIIKIILYLILAFCIVRSVPVVERIYKFGLEEKYISIYFEYFGEIILILYLIFGFIRNKIKNKDKKINEIQGKIDKKIEECYEKLNPFIELFKSNIANEIIISLMPTLNLDKNFDIKRYAELVNQYGLKDRNDMNFTTLDLISGDILGNPFLIIKRLYNYVKDEVYTGTRTVSWTEYYTDSDGKTKSRTESEVLVASITRPKQCFEDVIHLIYGSNVAEHLNFSRQPNHIHKLKERKYKKLLKKEIKSLQKITEKAIKKGKNFTPIANEEFETMFKAYDRDNEVEFRLLFTPIGQKNMLELLKDENFGDDFYFNKMEKLNVIGNENKWELNVDKSYYKNYDFETIKERFFDINMKFLDNFYRLFLPIISIPAYHQYKTQKFIYGEDYDFNYNPYTSEYVANSLGNDIFQNRESSTHAILKTKKIGQNKDMETYEVLAKSYKTIMRTTYVTKFARNGSAYQVAVHWPEYILVTQVSKIDIKSLNLSEEEFINSTDGEILKIKENKNYIYKNNLLGILRED